MNFYIFVPENWRPPEDHNGDVLQLDLLPWGSIPRGQPRLGGKEGWPTPALSQVLSSTSFMDRQGCNPEVRCLHLPRAERGKSAHVPRSGLLGLQNVGARRAEVSSAGSARPCQARARPQIPNQEPGERGCGAGRLPGGRQGRGSPGRGDPSPPPARWKTTFFPLADLPGS